MAVTFTMKVSGNTNDKLILHGDKMKIGVYVCHCGGNISEVVDVKAVSEYAGEQDEVVLHKDYSHLCSELGQKMIADDIKKEGLDGVVVSACSHLFTGKPSRMWPRQEG